MQKIRLHSLRLVPLDTHLPQQAPAEGDGGLEDTSGSSAGQYDGPALAHTDLAIQPEEKSTRGELEACHLLRRTPGNYALNQVYGLWFFISSFIMTIIITHKVPTEQYGVYAVALTAFNTIQYIVALGLEDATTTYLPRVFAEHGRASAARLIRRLLLLRGLVLGASLLIMLYGLSVLAYLITLIPLHGTADIAASLRDPVLLGHTTPIAVYVLGSGIANLLTAVCAALMRMKLVVLVGTATQLILLGLTFALLQMGLGIDSILWLLAIASLLNATAFAGWLAPLLFARGASYIQPLKPVLQLGIAAWLTNLASGALFKQVSILLLRAFAVSLTSIAYFNLAFQLADSANYLLVAGFGGIGGSALAAAFVGRNYGRLARSWQALIKVETLLAVTGLVFCLFNAQNIAHALYGSKYDMMGPLFAIFLFFNMLVRLLGATIHQSALYVLGKSRLVVLSQWLGLLVVVLLGIVLIPPFGAAGALIADGAAKTISALLMLTFLLKVFPRQYPRELLRFTLRFLLALLLAALPGLLWQPANRILIVVSALLFLLLSALLLLWLKPLSADDMELLTALNPRVAHYLRYFSRTL